MSKIENDPKNQNEEKNKPPSRWKRFKKYVKDSAVVKGYYNAADKVCETLFDKSYKEVKDKISNKYEAFKETRIGKAYRVLSSSTMGRVVGITLASLTIAGLTTPAAPAVAAALGALGLASVVAGAAIDTYQVRSARKLKNEHDLLVRNRDTKNLQTSILVDHPRLGEILKDQLNISDQALSKLKEENKKSLDKKYMDEAVKKRSKGEIAVEGIVRAAPAIASGILTASTTDVVSGVAKIGKTIFQVGINANDDVDYRKNKLEFKKAIDREREKNDGPGYKNINELRKKTRDQVVQTEALNDLAKNFNYEKLSDDKIKEAFETIKNQYAQDYGKIHEKGGVLERVSHSAMSVVKDFGRVLNPFDKYHDPAKHEPKTEPPEYNFGKESAIYTPKIAKKTFSPTDLSEVDRKEFNKDSKILKHNRENKEQLSNNESPPHLEPKKQAKNFNAR